MPRKRRLKTATDVRRYLAHLIHQTEAGQLEVQVSGRLGYLCNILLRAVEAGELEERVKALEVEVLKGGGS